jgi:serine/threonine protein kinase/tetratricopeptide (TPR) repeat protein
MARNDAWCRTRVRDDALSWGDSRPKIVFSGLNMARVLWHASGVSVAMLSVPGYEVRGLLAGGGMGSVYLARKHGAAGFVRSVAVKVVRAEASRGSELDAMLVREALLHARIEHPNVVRVEDFGTFAGGHFLVLEYIDGWSLSQVLRACAQRQVQLPVDLSASISQSALEGLGAIHDMPMEAGTRVSAVHGDVSPANLLLSRTGHVKVIDLGVAATDTDDPFTGLFVRGKAGYASKEQASASPIDRRADLYSMGVVLWEMLTCRRFRGSGEEAPPAPPSRFAPSVPADMDEVVMRALSEAPEDRYATARDMRRAIAVACPTSMFVDAATIADFVLTHLGSDLVPERSRFEPSALTRVMRGSPSDTETPQRRSTGSDVSGARTSSAGALLGRDADLERLRAALEAGHRVVAVTGPAGVGKSHFAATAAPTFPSSLLVSVSGVATVGELEHRVRVALRAGGAGTDVVPILAEHAKSHMIVLVLDGGESFDAEAWALTQDWCAALPELRVVFTTRHAPPEGVTLGIRLAPFPIPHATGQLRESPVFALWLQAVRRHDASYDPPEDSFEDVLAILRLTDGLPLAIRSAAGRMSSLGPRSLREELERSALTMDTDESSAPLRMAVESVLAQLEPDAREAAMALAHLGPMFSARNASFVLRRLGTPGPAGVLERLVDQNVLVRTDAMISMFSFFRAYLAQRYKSSPAVAHVKAAAREFLRVQARSALFDAAARTAADEDMPAYLEALGQMAFRADLDPDATAWLSDVVSWLATEHQSLAPLPAVIAASRVVLDRADPGHAAAHMLLAHGLIEAPEQERHALAALQACRDLEPPRSQIAISFGAAWMLAFLGRAEPVRTTAAHLRAVAANPEHLSLDRLKASLLQAALRHGVDDPFDGGELVPVLHGLRREGDRYDVANVCRLLVQCDQSELVERHVREVFSFDHPIRTTYSASLGATYAEALFDLGRVAEAQRCYALTLEHRRPRELPNHCWRSLLGAALCAAHEEQYEAARQSMELLLETTTLPGVRRTAGGLLAWLLVRTERKVPSWVEQLRSQPGQERSAGDVWWALADHCAARTESSLAALRDAAEGCAPSVPHMLASRAALRFAEREFASPFPGQAARAWKVRDDGAHIEAPGGAAIVLASRPLLARLALVLAEAHQSGAEPYLSIEQIVAKCWPDERMSEDSAANRVRVCIARLRDAGLRPLLDGSRTGYRFRPDLPLVIHRAS